MNVLFLSMSPEEHATCNVYIDYGTGKSGKVLPLNAIHLPENLRFILTGFHAFKGNDVVSSIFSENEENVGKTWEKFRNLRTCFRSEENLGIWPIYQKFSASTLNFNPEKL